MVKRDPAMPLPAPPLLDVEPSFVPLAQALIIAVAHVSASTTVVLRLRWLLFDIGTAFSFN
jgi:hypothetical protein